MPPESSFSESEVSEKTVLSFLGVKTRFARILFATLLGIVLFSAIVAYRAMPPVDFPRDVSIIVPRGYSLGEVSLLLKERHYIRSRFIFEFCARSIQDEGRFQAGEYMFSEPVSACVVAARLAHGETGVPLERVTFPEGVSKKEMAAIAHQKLSQFNEENFLHDTSLREGYLFPETYLLPSLATEQDVARSLTREFDRVVKTLESDIAASGYTLNQIVIMASILEKEARTPEDQALVSGILWKRIATGMRLQVDAPFLYALGKTSAELTQTDLKTPSPYNTYTNKGLPVAPIGNPGLSALTAAIHPKSSPYLYYLSDNDGVMHYAKTFEEHKANKAKYLR